MCGSTGGELEKLIERSVDHTAPSQPAPSSYEREREERRQDHQQRYADPQRYARQPPPRTKRDRSWLGEILG